MRLSGLTALQIVERWPATTAQAGIIFHALAEPDERPYLVQQVFRITGRVDLDVLHRAITHLHDCQPALRMGFLLDRDGPSQFVLDQAQPRFESMDWSAMPAAKQERHLESLLNSDRLNSFILDHPPLVRFKFVRLAELSHWLVVTTHHAVLDGWSKQLLLGQLSKTYAALLDGLQPDEQSAPHPRVLSDWLALQDMPHAHRIWAEHFGPPLPTGVIAPRSREGAFGLSELSLEYTGRQAVGSARRMRVTLSTLAAAAWGLVLSGLLDQPRTVFAEVVSLRPPALPDINQAVGLYINTILTVADVRKTARVEEWLHELHQRRGQLRDVAYVPLTDLKSILAIQRDSLFDTLLSFQNFPLHYESDAHGLDFRLERDLQWTGYSLTAVVDRALAVRLIFDERRITTTEAEQIGEAFNQALAGLCRPGARLGDIIGVMPMVDLSHSESARDGRHGDDMSRPSASREPEGAPFEHVLVEIWRAILAISSITAEDSVFDLGADSLMVMRVSAELRQRTGVEVPLAVLFRGSTIRDTAAAIAETQARVT